MVPSMLDAAPVQAVATFASRLDHQRRLSNAPEPFQSWAGPNFEEMYLGLSACILENEPYVEVGLSMHDTNYSVDFCIHRVQVPQDPKERAIVLTHHCLKQARAFSDQHNCKFIGAGVGKPLFDLAPHICSALWKELDIVAMVLSVYVHEHGITTPTVPTADEQADSVVRKAIMHFGPRHLIRLQIGFRNVVQVDEGGLVRIVEDLEDYRKTVRAPTWRACLKYAEEIKKMGTKIAFFSSTPQGGGVALMRHALIRFWKLLGVDAKWYVPKPNPHVFRITKDNHNILQGVAHESVRLTKDRQTEMTHWIGYNAARYWLSEGGPLAPGGADVIIIDDPQMPGLIPLIKAARPNVPIIYRSHIEIRSDLVHREGSPQREVWDYMWERIQLADVFISHPVNKFVPKDVPLEKVGLLPATSDWLDGLNKHMRPFDHKYYMKMFRSICVERKTSKLLFPARDYIVQVARFDPSKGIPDVIRSYVKARNMLDDIIPGSRHPQLALVGHGAIDDPDASIIYDQIMDLLEQDEISPYASDIVVVRLPPSDQLLNSIMSNAKIALQLSLREGFEIKVSEALHEGIPIIATRAGGIPLQVQHGKSGYLVEVGDTTAVANHIVNLWTDKDLYKRMSDYAKANVSDEVSTVGSAASWMWMASKLAKGEKLLMHGQWVNDQMREEAGEPYEEGEPRLPRKGINLQGE